VRRRLRAAAARAGVPDRDGGVSGATQGPRLESRAEIARLARDGCAMVGMTGMPEAGLARERDLAYACCAEVGNRAAGRGDDIHTELARYLDEAIATVRRVLVTVLEEMETP
jgi:5'-methylthioinosine phosphorylase